MAVRAGQETDDRRGGWREAPIDALVEGEFPCRAIDFDHCALRVRRQQAHVAGGIALAFAQQLAAPVDLEHGLAVEEGHRIDARRGGGQVETEHEHRDQHGAARDCSHPGATVRLRRARHPL